MKMKLWYRASLAAFSLFSFASQAWAHPDCFSNYSFKEAKQKAQTDGKIFLVDAMATWCPPCRKMESTTWVDEAVQSWIKENAIAIQIDVDKDEAVASSLHIEAMPTMVVFTPQSGSTEFGRQVGYLSPSELLQWLNGAKSGKSAEEAKQEAAESGDDKIWDRAVNGRNLLSAGKYAEALPEYVWCWTHISDGSQHYETKLGVLPHEMKQLSSAYPPARAKFAAMREEAEKSGNRPDWILLNSILDENPRTLEWFDKAKLDAKQKSDIKKSARMLEPLLFSNMRYADCATYLFPDPLAKINELYKSADKMKHPGPDTEVAEGFDPFPSMVPMVYGAYVGAGREAEAKKIFDECLRLDNTQGMRDILDTIGKGMQKARALQSKASK